jgi:hypothetical protein
MEKKIRYSSNAFLYAEELHASGMQTIGLRQGQCLKKKII